MKNLSILLLLFIFPFFTTILAQDFCGGDHFFDSGGINNNYENNENITTVITPEIGQVVMATFLNFDLENNFDTLSVYDGPNDTFPIIGVFTGNTIPGPFIASDGGVIPGSLTFVFDSDGSINRSGWEARIECTTINCFRPTNVSVLNIIDNNIEILWTDINSPSPLNGWEIAVGEIGFDPNTTQPLTTDIATFLITDVNLCNVDIYVRAVCDTNEFSFWSTPLNVQLPSTTYNAPFYENFNTHTIPPCWFETGSEQWNFNLEADFDAEEAGDHTASGETNYAWINGSNPNGTGHTSNLNTPWIDISDLSIPNVFFSIFSLNTFENTYNTLDIILHEFSGSSTNILHLQGLTLNGDWQNFDFDISSLITDTVIRLEFIIEENSPNNPHHNDILIDDVKVRELPTCIAPNNININNIEIDQVQINWNDINSASNWQIEYGLDGFIQGNGTMISTTSHPYELNGLNSSTAYDFYLRANCSATIGEDDSEWVGPISFSTAFDFCNGDHFYDSGGAFGNYGNNENKITTITPQGADIVTITFLSFDLVSSLDTLEVFDGPNVNSPLLGIYSGSILPGPFTSTHDSGSLTFRFLSNGLHNSAGWDATVFCETVNCPRPSDLTISNITSTTGLLNWTNGGTESAWEIEFGPIGFTQGTGTTVFSNSNPFTINGLEQGTRQQAYIRANCGVTPGEDDSNWSEVITFTTPCGVFNAPFYENFNDNETPGCWFEFGDEFWNFTTDATFTASNAGDHTEGVGTNYAYIDGSSPTGADHISNLITPFVNVSNLTIPTVEFAIFSDNNDDNTYNTISVLLNEQNGTSTNILQLQESTNGWQVFSFDISFITDNLVQLEFIIEENSAGNSFFNDILIDDVKIEENPSIGTTDFTVTEIEFYPNPTQNYLTINSIQLLDKLIIYNTLEKQIYLKTTFNNTKFNIDFSKFSKGMYFVKTFLNNQSKTFKVIKQ